MALPAFLVIGVQRAGTTWLHECLTEHPQIFLPQIKEVQFFNANYEKGLDWYAAFFDDASPGQVIGEITPAYLHDASLETIARDLPGVKLIVVLRHPVDRAYSAYRLFNRQYQGMSFEEAFSANDYLRRLSTYAGRMREVYARFPRERIRCFLYDDVRDRPAQLLSEMFGFLEVDPGFVPPSTGETFNAVLFPRTQRLLGRLGLTVLVERLKATSAGAALKTLVRRTPSAVHQRSGHDPELMAVFREDILETQELIGRDLSTWLS